MRLTSTILLCVAVSAPLAAVVDLDQMMSPDDKKNTGFSSLTPSQKSALEIWIDQHFIVKSQKKQLSLSLNINGGKRLLLSDHSLYEIAPSDVATASAWLSPSIIDVVPSGDPNYPDKLLNNDTGVGVKAKRVTSSAPAK
ncbi:MAG: hypothetical protein ACHQT8_02320 [Chlamydiales bacterium]